MLAVLVAALLATTFTAAQPTAQGPLSNTIIDTLDVSGSSSCGLQLNDSSIWCWGGPYQDPLYAYYGFSTGYIANKFLLGGSWISISGSLQPQGAICGLLGNNSAYCWGDNSYGQLGNAYIAADDNTAVLGHILPGEPFKQIVSLVTSACGILANGTAVSWGDNSKYHLGIGDSLLRTSIPTPVATGGTWTILTASDDIICGLLTDVSSIWCWGQDADGSYDNLFSTPNFQSSVPVPVSIAGQWKTISLGKGHLCGIGSDDKVYCIGSNQYGQLGDGTTDSRNTIAPVATDFKFKSISAVEYVTCGVLTDNTAVCWGDNSLGGVGTGQRPALDEEGNPITQDKAETAVTRPTQVFGNYRYSEVNAGPHSCGRNLDDGSVWCWGDNSRGQADPTTSDPIVYEPVPVPGFGPLAYSDRAEAVSATPTSDGGLSRRVGVFAAGVVSGLILLIAAV